MWRVALLCEPRWRQKRGAAVVKIRARSPLTNSLAHVPCPAWFFTASVPGDADGFECRRPDGPDR